MNADFVIPERYSTESKIHVVFFSIKLILKKAPI